MGRLMAFLGIPVCSAIVAYALVYIVVLWFGGEPPTVGSIAAAGIFGGLSLVVVLISLNSWVQDRKHGVRQGLWILIPALLAAGAVAGSVMAFILAQDRLELLEQIDRGSCTTLLGEEAPASTLDACIPVARHCRRENEDAEVEIGAIPQGLPAGVRVSRAQDAIVLICIHERLSELP